MACACSLGISMLSPRQSWLAFVIVDPRQEDSEIFYWIILGSASLPGTACRIRAAVNMRGAVGARLVAEAYHFESPDSRIV